MSNKTWILVADHSRAQLYVNVGPGKRIEKLKDLVPPPAQAPRHPDAHDGIDRRHEGEQFAGQISSLLQDGRVKHNFDKLILVAAPKFLGQIRAKLDRETTKAVSATLDKDLTSFSDAEILAHLNDSFFTF